MNRLGLQKGRNLPLTKEVSIFHPTLNEIEQLENDMGEDTYMLYLCSLISNTKDVADILWFDRKIWYEDIKSEWEFFIQKALIDKRVIEVTQLIDGESISSKALAINEDYNNSLNFFLKTKGNYVLYEMEQAGGNITQLMLALVDETNNLHEDCFKFTEYFYSKTITFLKEINWVNIEHDFLKGGSRGAKEYILKQKYKKRGKKTKDNIDISSIVSVVAKGNDYFSIWDYPIYMIYELYHRLLKIEEYDNTIRALYSGALDTTKNPINWEKINWSAIITY